MRKKTGYSPMRKWCRDCEQFKDNPKNKKNPQYCEDCLNKRFIAGQRKKSETWAKKKKGKV